MTLTPKLLATMTRLHQRRRDEAAAEVRRADEAIALVDGQIASANAEVDAAKRWAKNAGGVDDRLAAERFELQTAAQIANLRATREKLTQEKQRRQARLVESQTSLRQTERLTHKQHQTQIAAEAKRRQAELDDWTASRR